MASQRILIVGGGFTGLTAALRLTSQPGCEVHMWEKSPDLGGLAGGFTIQGYPLEKAYHYLFLSDRIVADLAAELGLGDRLDWHPASNGIYLDGRIWPFNTPLDLLRFAPAPFWDRLRTGLTALRLKQGSDPAPYEPHTALEWMRRACGAGAVRTIWEPLLRGKFSSYAESVSMAWLWARLNIRARSRQGAGERFGYFRGGFQCLVDGLADRVRQQGGTIAVSRSIAALATGPDGRIRVTDQEGATEEFSRVVFTGSSRAFARLVGSLPATPELDAYRAQLAALPYLDAACLVFASRQELPLPFWLNVNEAGAPFVIFVHHTRMVPKSQYGGLNVYYIGAYQPPGSPLLARSDPDLIDHWLGYLGRICPAFDRQAIVEQRLFRLADAQHVVMPGHTARIPSYRTPVPGLYLANYAQIYPEDRGSNYAVREGDKIARLVLKDSRRG